MRARPSTASGRSCASLLERQPAGRRLPAILIQGETGTGKGLVARLVHRMGPRKGGPFVDINCPAIPETLLEAELFGFERGAFTDARRAKPGLFHTAHRGTLFLDEVGLLPESVQAKLLTVLEERAVRRLGSTQPEAVDVCFDQCHEHRPPGGAVRARRFREDLYHRLAVITFDLPPLRDRGRDVLLLAERFLARACVDYGLPPKTPGRAGPGPPARPSLARQYPRAGQRDGTCGALRRRSRDHRSDAGAAGGGGAPASGPARPAREPAPSRRRRRCASISWGCWSESAGNISHAAARLGIARNTLYARLEKYGVRSHHPPPRRRSRPETAPAPAPTGTRIQWEGRGITLLRAALVEPDGGDEASPPSRALEGVIDTLQTFGGRVEERDADERRGLVRGRSGGGCAAARGPCRDGHSQKGRARP